jgi:hypothetical protein
MDSGRVTVHSSDDQQGGKLAVPVARSSRWQHCIALAGLFDSDRERASQLKKPGTNCRGHFVLC